jgi:hypothetical protein
MNPKSTPMLPWLEALKFSLRVMRKSFFKLFIPSMALSFVMGAFHFFIGSILFAGHHLGEYFSVKLISFLIIYTVVALPIYASMYPLLKRYALLVGLQGLNPLLLREYKQLPRKNRLSVFLGLVKISLKRFWFQSLSFFILLLPVSLYVFYNLRGIAIILLASIVALLPVAWSYFTCFFAELDYLVEKTQELKPDSNKSTNPNLLQRKYFWTILSLKSLLFVVFIALLIGLNLIFHSFKEGGKLYLIKFFKIDFVRESLSPFLVITCFFPWFDLSSFSHSILSYTFWLQAVFLLLFGLLTAFFFLVETLSSVYFYHIAQRKMENSSLSGVDLEEV